MSASARSSRPGLAGGIDKDGSRAVELLAAGFASVEFGTVTARPEPGGHPGVAALVVRLSALAPRRPGATRIGIGIGSSAAPEALAAEWHAGLCAAWGAADYLSFNLSARICQPLLSNDSLPLLLRAIDAVVAERQRRSAAGGPPMALALKLALGATGAFPLRLAEAAADAGFDSVTAVLPEGTERLPRLQVLASRLHGKAALLAVGGIRSAADIRAALAAGADGVQVHTLFAQHGAACLPMLYGIEAN
jgi:dihydroorotate dehydrogenase